MADMVKSSSNQEERPALFNMPRMPGVRVPAAGIFNDWETHMANISEFMQQTLTTAMVTLWAAAPAWTLFLYIYLVVYVKVLRVVLLIYLVYCLFDPRPYDGIGRRTEWVRKLPIWDHIRSYFQIQMVFEEPLDARKRYVFGCHPHGVISYMAQLIGGPTGMDFGTHCPGLVVRGVTMPFSFCIPFFRDYALAMGCLSCDRNSIRRILTPRYHRLHQSLLVVVGGAEESMLAHPGSADLVLLKRKGFVREAIRAGCDLAPVYNFNENSIYRLANNAPGTWAYKFEMAVKSWCGFTLLLFHGRNPFYTPYQCQLTSVVGKPIEVKMDRDPSSKDIDHYHQLYVEELTRLYAKYKPKFAPQDRDLKFIA